MILTAESRGEIFKQISKLAKVIKNYKFHQFPLIFNGKYAIFWISWKHTVFKMLSGPSIWTGNVFTALNTTFWTYWKTFQQTKVVGNDFNRWVSRRNFQTNLKIAKIIKNYQFPLIFNGKWLIWGISWKRMIFNCLAVLQFGLEMCLGYQTPFSERIKRLFNR